MFCTAAQPHDRAVHVYRILGGCGSAAETEHIHSLSQGIIGSQRYAQCTKTGLSSHDEMTG